MGKKKESTEALCKRPISLLAVDLAEMTDKADRGFPASDESNSFARQIVRLQLDAIEFIMSSAERKEEERLQNCPAERDAARVCIEHLRRRLEDITEIPLGARIGFGQVIIHMSKILQESASKYVRTKEFREAIGRAKQMVMLARVFEEMLTNQVTDEDVIKATLSGEMNVPEGKEPANFREELAAKTLLLKNTSREYLKTVMDFIPDTKSEIIVNEKGEITGL